MGSPKEEIDNGSLLDHHNYKEENLKNRYAALMNGNNHNHLSNGHIEKIQHQASFQDKDQSTKDASGCKEDVGQRDTWEGKLDFLMSTLSFTVGMGNLWRFPYLCYINGGGAFLIPYLIMVILVGMPVMYLEFVFGQYGRKGVVSTWNACPLFKGVGWAMISLSAIIATYYNVLISWCFYYIVMSFTKVLPWSHCGNWWNTETGCADVKTMSDRWNCTSHNGTWSMGGCVTDSQYVIVLPENSTYSPYNIYNNTNNSVLLNQDVNEVKSPSDEFFHYNMLDISEGLHDIGYPRWQLVLCLLFTWVLICVCLSKGIKSSGKATYVTSLFPYVVLTILFVRGLMLEGAAEGITFLFKPDFNKLLSPKVWGDAAVQMFFSMSLCWGGLSTLASYNKFNNNVLRDAIVVTLGDTLTSIFGGVVIFSYIGYMAHILNTSVDQVATQGAGLAFIVYPQAVTMLPLPQLWSVLFMVMLINVGTGTVFGLIQTIQSTILDEVPSLSKGRRPLLVLICMCGFFFLLGIPYTTRGGIYILQLVDNYGATYSVLCLGISMCLILAWVYGTNNLHQNIQSMMGFKPNILFTIMWKFVCPAICLVILGFSLVDSKRTSYSNYTLPFFCDVIGAFIPVFQISLIPAFAIYQIFKCDLNCSILKKIKYLTMPTADWGKHHHNIQDQPIEEMKSLNGQLV